ncbi:glucose-6-phosphate isomerase [Maridesulfovibrio ferrireducens]|uniref:glucose-6-phosphate isomerase n=1 Tax=Maridesulfovibrio ferrireducens TaxID=246191 RepID=UPI001A2AE73A|nr:glucose-6-phosphate isomerase [Maridesulfovibrio ferrireducens]MBI9111169.1 glucose-6-phosphate isomerase [Maridesulfovibrio ferrireducens]
MAANIIDWTDSWQDKLDIKSKYASADAISARFSKEVAEGKLPFCSMPYMAELLYDLEGLEDYVKGFDHMLLLGIGGSALGARALQKAFFSEQDEPCHKGPWFWIGDNVCAKTLESYLEKLPLEKTLVAVVSKSGGTIETISQYFLIRKKMQKKLGEKWNRNFLFVTDKKSGFLREQADELSIRTLDVPDNLGGRYSVLSAVGLLPAMFMGIDYRSLVEGASAVLSPLASSTLDAETLLNHPSYKIACWNAALMEKGYNELIFFSYIPQWACFGQWFAQLWAESLGKEGKGSQPIPAVGATDQHSVNQMFLDGPRNKGCLFLTCDSLPHGEKFLEDIPDKFSYIKGKSFGDLIHAEGLGTKMALSANDVPLVEFKMAEASEESAGRLMGVLMAATIFTGWMMGINPIDQPAVELGKRLAKARLGADGLQEEKNDLEAFLSTKREEQIF